MHRSEEQGTEGRDPKDLAAAGTRAQCREGKAALVVADHISMVA